MDPSETFRASLLRSAQAAALPEETRSWIADLPRTAIERMRVHEQCLGRWKGYTSLVGPGTQQQLVERHFLESLRGWELCRGALGLADIGSGAGFPGLVLAALEPERPVWLIDAREKKAAFLRQTAHSMGLQRVSVVCVRLGGSSPLRHPSHPPPGSVDCLTLRAIRFDPSLWSAVEPWLAPGATIVRWEGADPLTDELPLESDRSLPISTDSSTRITAYRSFV